MTRITPAGAGKTDGFARFLTVLQGSPPQVRGKPRLPRVTDIYDGDHPRRCGENLTVSSSSLAWTGSPPQVRGKRKALIVDDEARRITPAGAGKTRSDSSEKCTNKDHPRRCGENRLRSTMEV